jgi:hypothetical protein
MKRLAILFGKGEKFAKLIIMTFAHRSNNFLDWLSSMLQYAWEKQPCLIRKKHSSTRFPGIANQNYGQVARNAGKKILKQFLETFQIKVLYLRLVKRFVADADPDPY